MPKLITVTALKPLMYQGRSHVPGSVFTATPVDAASLKYRGLAKLGGQLSGGTVPEHQSITRRMETVEGFQHGAPSAEKPEPPMPANEQTVEQLPAAEHVAEADVPRTGRSRRGRGTYNRRDMNAEPPTNDTGE